MKKGSIYTVAGCGKIGSEGDGGDAKLAMLNEPKDLTIDNNGCLYIADSENNLIRFVNSNGSIDTIAGSITLSETEEDKKADETEYQRVLDTVPRKAGMNAELIGDNGAAISAKLRFPSAIAVDHDGNLYISDTHNHRVRKMNRKNGVITTIAGNGDDQLSGDNGPATEASLSEPTGIAIDREGNIYIADLRNNKIRIVERASGIIKTFAGNGDDYFSGDDGPAVNASLSGPSGVVLDKNENIFIADTFNNVIRRVDANTGIITTVAGDGDRFKINKKETTANSLARPHSIALDSKGNIYTTDSDNHLVRKIDGNSGEITNVAGNGTIGFSTDGTPAYNAALNYPFGMAIDSKDNVYVADTFNHRIRKIFN
ncbi:MAG: NHL repeat-containing protein [Nitrospinota bacterium]|nr:NHL repeat-containing protein [Nitrospinota bacterium]